MALDQRGDDDWVVSHERDRSWAVTVGSQLCPECGEVSAEEHRPGWWQRFRYWFVNGSKAPTTLTCPNGHRWARSVAVISFRRRDGWRWLRLPMELARVVLRERRATPTPMTYSMAAGVGLILGLVLEIVAGWTWWVVSVAFLCLVWLLFLASALGGRGRDLGRELGRVIDPERAAARDRQVIEDAVRSGSLAGYEVMGWKGDKTIGGWGGSQGNPRSLTITHGVLEVGAEAVEVTAHIGEVAAAASHWLQEKLGRELAQTQAARPDGAEDMHLWHLERERAIRKAVPPQWRPASFRLDGQAVPGQIARAGDQWVAHLSTDTVVIEMIGSHVDPSQIELTRLLSLDGYG